MALSRVLLVLTSVVLFSYAYYASTPPDVNPDTGSVLVVLAACAVWLAPYVWWYRRLIKVTTNTKQPKE